MPKQVIELDYVPRHDLSFECYPWAVFHTACDVKGGHHYQRRDSARCFCGRVEYVAPEYVGTVDDRGRWTYQPIR